METAEHYQPQAEPVPTGGAAAAILSAGIGVATLGLLTTLAEVSECVKAALNLYSPVGPLSGKTAYSVGIWLVVWLASHLLWNEKQVNFASTFFVTLVLIALGLLGTFPPFYFWLAGLAA